MKYVKSPNYSFKIRGKQVYKAYCLYAKHGCELDNFNRIIIRF